MEQVTTHGLISRQWTKEELDLLKCLIDLKIPVDVISEELERSLTATSLKAAEMKLNPLS